jgi:hypothetical protein
MCVVKVMLFNDCLHRTASNHFTFAVFDISCYNSGTLLLCARIDLLPSCAFVASLDQWTLRTLPLRESIEEFPATLLKNSVYEL